MGNNLDNWKVVVIAGTFSISVCSSAAAALDQSGVSDANARLQQIRKLAEQGKFVVRDHAGTMIIAGDEYNKIDSGKKSSSKGK